MGTFSSFALHEYLSTMVDNSLLEEKEMLANIIEELIKRENDLERLSNNVIQLITVERCFYLFESSKVLEKLNLNIESIQKIISTISSSAIPPLIHRISYDPIKQKIISYLLKENIQKENKLYSDDISYLIRNSQDEEVLLIYSGIYEYRFKEYHWRWIIDSALRLIELYIQKKIITQRRELILKFTALYFDEIKNKEFHSKIFPLIIRKRLLRYRNN